MNFDTLPQPNTQSWWLASVKRPEPKIVTAAQCVQTVLANVRVRPSPSTPEKASAAVPNSGTGKRIVPEFERELMLDARELLGADEMKRNGGMWRALIIGRGGHPPRPGKVRRVLETIRVEQLEHKKPKTTWGCRAMNLFQTFADWPSDRNP